MVEPLFSVLVIFNLFAVPVLAAILLLGFAVNWMWPMANHSLGGWLSGLLFFGVGGLAEIVGIRGRVFFLPIWVIGAGILCYEAGWIGVSVFVVLAIAGMILFQRRTGRREAEKWQKIQTFALAQPPSGREDEVAFWQWAKDALFLPIFTPYSPAVCDHDLSVLRQIRDSGAPLSVDELDIIRDQEHFFREGQKASLPPANNAKERHALEDLLNGRLKKARKAQRMTGIAPTRPKAAG